MVTLLGLPSVGESVFGLGLIGFLNGKSLGSQDSKPLHNLLNTGGLRLFSPRSAATRSSLLELPETKKKADRDVPSSTDNDDDQGDQVELSDFAKNAAQQAVEDAKKSPASGTTKQIYVSQDGRFQASIDLQKHADGSFDLDLSVGFAQSQTAQLYAGNGDFWLPEASVFTAADADAVSTDNGQDLDTVNQSAAFAVQRQTAFEQTIQTRDLQVRIFYEESKSVALLAGNAYGADAANQYNSVAQQVSQEFKLNLSIHGSALENFNAAAADLVALDDSGTFSRFLQTAAVVLNADSSNLGSFLEATRSLMDSVRDHVTAKLSDFFSSMNQDYGKILETQGFPSNYFETTGKDVRNDLQDFFALTQNLLNGTDNQITAKNTDVQQTLLEAVKDNLELLQEKNQKEEEINKNYLSNNSASLV